MGGGQPEPIPVTGLDIYTLIHSLWIGRPTQGLNYFVLPTNATNKAVDIQIADTSIARVVNNLTDYPYIDALQLGETTATITTLDGGFSESVNLRVVGTWTPITGYSVSPNPIEVKVGEIAPVSISSIPENANNSEYRTIFEPIELAGMARQGVQGWMVGTGYLVVYNELNSEIRVRIPVIVTE